MASGSEKYTIYWYKSQGRIIGETEKLFTGEKESYLIVNWVVNVQVKEKEKQL